MDTLIPEETYVGLNGEEYKIYPMILKDYAKVNRLFSKIDDEILYFNLPEMALDKENNPIMKDGKPKYDYTRFNAMCELFEMALHIPRDKFLEIIDLNTGVFVLDAYRGISGLKKKIQQQAAVKMMQDLIQLSPPSSKTQVKPEKQ